MIERYSIYGLYALLDMVRQSTRAHQVNSSTDRYTRTKVRESLLDKSRQTCKGHLYVQTNLFIPISLTQTNANWNNI